MREWLSGRASPCQGERREFESRLPLQKHKRDASDLVRHFCYKAPWPSGKAKVCNTYIPSSSLGGASRKDDLFRQVVFSVIFAYGKLSVQIASQVMN